MAAGKPDMADRGLVADSNTVVAEDMAAEDMAAEDMAAEDMAQVIAADSFRQMVDFAGHFPQ